MKKIISGWGRINPVKTKTYIPNNLTGLKKLFNKANMIFRGNGRSYGDSSIQKNKTIFSSKFNKIINFDKKKGKIKVQSGILLKNLLEKTIPDGWFVPVSPGTKYVSIGGMVASNVHGKNQHIDGCFINFIKSIILILPNGKKKYLSKKKNRNLFYATCGGMGLTGFILEVEFDLLKINSSIIKQDKSYFFSLEELISEIKKRKEKYVVAWVDFFSFKNDKVKSILYTGEHYKSDKVIDNYSFKKEFLINEYIAQIINFFFISFAINLLNKTKYFLDFKNKKKITDINNFFYPLDSVINWNIIYGKKGFAQYQFVVPYKYASKTIKKIFNIFNKNKLKPYLIVIKNMKKDAGILTFAMNGISVAIDVPNKDNLLSTFKKIDKIVISSGGKIYLAKDNFISSSNFKKMYRNYNEFIKIRKKYKLSSINSSQSIRLKI